MVVTPTVVDPLTDNSEPAQPDMPIPTLDQNNFDKSLGKNLNPRPTAPPLNPERPPFGDMEPMPLPAGTSPDGKVVGDAAAAQAPAKTRRCRASRVRFRHSAVANAPAAGSGECSLSRASRFSECSCADSAECDTGGSTGSWVSAAPRVRKQYSGAGSGVSTPAVGSDADSGERAGAEHSDAGSAEHFGTKRTRAGSSERSGGDSGECAGSAVREPSKSGDRSCSWHEDASVRHRQEADVWPGECFAATGLHERCDDFYHRDGLQRRDEHGGRDYGAIA